MNASSCCFNHLSCGFKVQFCIDYARNSFIGVKKNTYSVPRRLIGRELGCLIEMDEIIVWYAGQAMQRMPRLIGSDKILINYRHVIDTLVRKPGAFENYKHREEMFPNSDFRMAYESLLAAPAKEEGQILVLKSDCEGVTMVNRDAARLRAFEDKPQRPENRRMPTVSS